MKCETFTYSAHVTDYSVAGAVGPQEALLISPQGALSAARNSSAPIPSAVLRFWFWMKLQACVCLPKAALPDRPVSQPSHIWHVPTSNPDAPHRAVRVNRSILRKLRRLQRLHPASYFDGSAYRPEGERPDLSPRQYLEYMIRKHKWSRVRTHGLNASRRDLILCAVTSVGLQGDAASLRMAGMCNALISPD